MNLVRFGWRFGLFMGVTSALAAIHTIGCSSTPVPTPVADDANSARQASDAAAERESQPVTMPDAPAQPPVDSSDASDAGDAGDAADAADASDASACDGMPNGAAVQQKGTNRCCDGRVVDLRTADNCGGCGIRCPVGFACEQEPNGHWGCGCLSSDSCVASVGPGATCYTPPGGRPFCNCQCEGKGPCLGACNGGATCTEVIGHNYCSYPADGQ